MSTKNIGEGGVPSDKYNKQTPTPNTTVHKGDGRKYSVQSEPQGFWSKFFGSTAPNETKADLFAKKLMELGPDSSLTSEVLGHLRSENQSYTGNLAKDAFTQTLNELSLCDKSDFVKIEALLKKSLVQFKIWNPKDAFKPDFQRTTGTYDLTQFFTEIYKNNDLTKQLSSPDREFLRAFQKTVSTFYGRKPPLETWNEVVLGADITHKIGQVGATRLQDTRDKLTDKDAQTIPEKLHLISPDHLGINGLANLMSACLLFCPKQDDTKENTTYRENVQNFLNNLTDKQKSTFFETTKNLINRLNFTI